MRPMIFQVDRVFELFDEQGFIYSVRREPKEVGEKVWIRRSRTGEKEFDARIKMCKEIPLDNFAFFLKDYVENSGFDKVHEWVMEIEKNLNGSKPEFLYLHQVKRV